MIDALRSPDSRRKVKGKKQKAKGKRTGWSFPSSELFRLDPFAFCLLLFAFCLLLPTGRDIL
jgi:hypothetical protein